VDIRGSTAEAEVLPLAGERFCVTVLRQATLYGASPRMRFDLAVNGMAWGAWSAGVLPLMRDGSQWRPLMHVRDAAAAIRFVLGQPPERVNGRVLNVGPRDGNLRLADLARRVAAALPRPVRTEWYGDPDARSYRVSFERLAALGWEARHGIGAAVAEVAALLEAGRLARTPRTITLDWYDALERRYRAISDPRAAFG
jgi:nucleoside-diphosphate-sugar epimerase